MVRARKTRDVQSVRDLRDALLDGLAEGRIDIPEAVRRMREISGLTQAEFARHRGISLPALKRIEAGKANPTMETLNAIGRIFGLKVGFVRASPADP